MKKGFTAPMAPSIQPLGVLGNRPMLPSMMKTWDIRWTWIIPKYGLLVPAPKTGADGMLPVRAADKLEPTSPGAKNFNKTDRTFPVFIEDIRMITSMINIGLVNKSRARSADQDWNCLLTSKGRLNASCTQ